MYFLIISTLRDTYIYNTYHIYKLAILPVPLGPLPNVKLASFLILLLSRNKPKSHFVLYYISKNNFD